VVLVVGFFAGVDVVGLLVVDVVVVFIGDLEGTFVVVVVVLPPVVAVVVLGLVVVTLPASL